MGANRKDDRQINFRVSEQEYLKLEQMAQTLGMSVPAFCKAKAQGVRLVTPKIDRAGALEMASELRKIGVNINQIAKQLNSGENCSESHLEALGGIRKGLGLIWRQLNSVIQGVRAD